VNDYTDRLKSHAKSLASQQTPFLVLDPSIIRQNYIDFVEQFKTTMSPYHVPEIFYAVKANPHPTFLSELVDLGCSFDVASVQEIKDVIAVDRFINKKRISYGNTVKKSADIGYAIKKGVRTFAVDSLEELEKIALEAKRHLGTKSAEVGVYARLETDGKGADWALGRKFGTNGSVALQILSEAHKKGLTSLGCSFHVGSNQKDPLAWVRALESVQWVYSHCKDLKIPFSVINIGGGFPAFSVDNGNWLSVYSYTISKALIDLFGYHTPLRIMFEPGRALAANAGVVVTEVVLNSASRVSNQRWLTLDAGVFSGFVETVEEAIKYPIETSIDNPSNELVSYKVAGPSCDSMDAMYQKHQPRLPVNLKEGDRLYFLNTGCYFSTYATVAFNGFAPPTVIVI